MVTDNVERSGTVFVQFCPACRRLAHLPRGFVHVTRAVLGAQAHDFERVLAYEVDRDRHEDWLGDARGFRDDGENGIVITTTTEALAVRLGDGLRRALGTRAQDGGVRAGILAMPHGVTAA